MTSDGAEVGRIGRDWRDSVPWWPEVPTPPEGAPNVLLVVLDDVGFAQIGCYGSDIATPTFDRLAAEGVRLGNFRTTALCSPTRACLLTGRNHHRSGMGRVADLPMGYPGYWGKPPKENGFLSEILRSTGYATYALGKWHLSPEDEIHMGASRATWPLGRGFDRWYGFHGGETHQFFPALYHDNHATRPKAFGDPEFTLSGERPLVRAEPVCHVSYFEADAFARWAGARLPTEFEWEAAADGEEPDDPLDATALHPAPATEGRRQFFGTVWEWTASGYAPYPGFRPAPGAVGEYNGKFMVNQYVLRGGSCITPSAHMRITYRNFFPAASRWMFAGARLARDL